MLQQVTVEKTGLLDKTHHILLLQKHQSQLRNHTLPLTFLTQPSLISLSQQQSSVPLVNLITHMRPLLVLKMFILPRLVTLQLSLMPNLQLDFILFSNQVFITSPNPFSLTTPTKLSWVLVWPLLTVEATSAASLLATLMV